MDQKLHTLALQNHEHNLKILKLKLHWSLLLLWASSILCILHIQVDPIGPKRMLAFLNHFIVHTSSFLNRFSVICEEKLEDLSVRLQRLETTVCLLETKVGMVVMEVAA